MHHTSIKTLLVFLLIFALTYAQLAPGFAAEKSKSNKVKVAFVGIKFDDVPDEARDRVLERVQELLEKESSFQLAKPDELEKQLSKEKLADFFAQPDSAAFRTLADELQVDYLFAGRIANQSREANRVLLVGELVRFDRAAGILNKFEVLKYYDHIGVELLKFQEEFVKTIVPSNAGGNKALPFIVLGGVTLAGIVALVLSTSKSGSEGEGGGSGGDRP
ncbi:hypothetical protein L0337_01850 [candidate division KSB1 bacterium]|nr:hypothetical protein [candidate division KSB1 bacterium]